MSDVASTSAAQAPAKTKFERKRAKTPTVLQMEAVECGAAALAIILAYYGRFVPLEELRHACGVSRDGSKASNILKAARGYGLKTTGYRLEMDALAKMRLPLIIHWKFTHFLVLEGFGRGKVYLNDPATGPRTVTWEEFDNNFTGVVLEFEPTADFVKGGTRFSTFAALKARFGNSRTELLYVLLAGLSLVIPGLLVPAFSRVFVDFYLIRGLKDWLLPLLIGLALTAIIRGAITYLKEYYLLKLETKLAVSMSGKFFWHVLRLPLEYYAQRYAGEIGNRVAINDQVATLLSGKLASTLLDIVTITFYAFLMFLYDPALTLVGIAIGVINILALRWVSRRRVDLNSRLLQERGKLMGISMSGLRMVETLKSIGRESDFFARWAGYQAKVLKAQQDMGVYTAFLMVVPPLLTAFNVALILMLGGLRVVEGQMTIGMLVAFQSMMLSFLEPVNKLVGMGSTVQEVQGGLKRLDDVMNNKTDEGLKIDETATDISKRLPKLKGYLTLKNVSFGYSRLQAPLIQDFNLSLKPGTRVALVGGSGSGKSTVAKLVSGLYSPWEGEILFDNKPRTAIPRSTITNSLAVVDQDIFLFEGNVRDNLTLWDSTMPENQVVQAAHDSAIHADIAARPNGYTGDVAEGGTNFSGGQRQRLEIARALANDPVLLVLDEATSALDPITEKQIDEHLRRRGCTCLIIAHRLSTIRDCDEIIVMSKGKIVQRGTHDELVQDSNSHYAKLIAGY
jgi:NHLM bacteriocin system ABC transporter peptidase/ATP-binding protein